MRTALWPPAPTPPCPTPPQLTRFSSHSAPFLLRWCSVVLLAMMLGLGLGLTPQNASLGLEFYGNGLGLWGSKGCGPVIWPWCQCDLDWQFNMTTENCKYFTIHRINHVYPVPVVCTNSLKLKVCNILTDFTVTFQSNYTPIGWTLKTMFKGTVWKQLSVS